MIVADRHELVSALVNDSRYQRDISREDSGSMTGELIIGLHIYASNRWKLRNYDLSTAVDKAVSNSNLIKDFRLPDLADRVRREEGEKE
jgi:hypothetical protein